MKAYEVVSGRVKKTGMTVAELSRRSGISQELLRRSLSGKRAIRADELISLCVQLDLSFRDFVASDHEAG